MRVFRSLLLDCGCPGPPCWIVGVPVLRRSSGWIVGVPVLLLDCGCPGPNMWGLFPAAASG